MAEATIAQIRAEKLVNKLWNDATHGAVLQKLAKDEFPEAGIVPVDETFAPALAPLKAQNEKLADELKALREERDAERKAREKDRAEAEKLSFEQKIVDARKAYQLTDEGFDKMVERMKSTGNYVDPEAAAAWVASKTPPAPVPGPTFGPQSLNLFGSEKPDESLAQLHRDPQKYQDDQLAAFARNPDAYVQETLGSGAW